MLVDYCQQCPATAEKRKGVRGKFRLTRYMSSAGTRKCSKKLRNRKKREYEAFLATMKAGRQWAGVKAHAEWKKLEVPANFADNAGPPPHTRRLRIPAHLLCLDESESGEEGYEDRTLQTYGSEIRNATAEEKTQLQEELRQGFSAHVDVPDQSVMEKSLSLTAATLSPLERVTSVGKNLLCTAASAIAALSPPVTAEPPEDAVG